MVGDCVPSVGKSSGHSVEGFSDHADESFSGHSPESSSNYAAGSGRELSDEKSSEHSLVRSSDHSPESFSDHSPESSSNYAAGSGSGPSDKKSDEHSDNRPEKKFLTEPYGKNWEVTQKSRPESSEAAEWEIASSLPRHVQVGRRYLFLREDEDVTACVDMSTPAFRFEGEIMPQPAWNLRRLQRYGRNVCPHQGAQRLELYHAVFGKRPSDLKSLGFWFSLVDVQGRITRGRRPDGIAFHHVEIFPDRLADGLKLWGQGEGIWGIIL